MKKKKLIAGIVVVVALLVFAVLFFGNSDNAVGQKTEDKIVSQWSNVPVNGHCDSNIKDGFYIKEDGTIEGIEGFKEYEIEETDTEIDYLVVSGGYEDTTRYEVYFNEDDLLVMKEEDVSEGLTCYFEKVE